MSAVQSNQQVSVELKSRKQEHYDNPVFADLEKIPKEPVVGGDPQSYDPLDGSWDTEEDQSRLKGRLTAISASFRAWRSRNGIYVRNVAKTVLLLLALAYTSYCLYRDFRRALPLFVFMCLGLAGATFSILRTYAWPKVYKSCSNPQPKTRRTLVVIRWIIYLGLTLGLLIYFGVIANVKRTDNIKSLAGYIVFLVLVLLTSANVLRINWRPVVGGLLLQFVFALVVLRTQWGFQAFDWLALQIRIFLAYTDEGAKFIFGNSFEDHFFAFKAMPLVVFFSAFITMLYYLGVMQIIIVNLSRIMQVVMGTTAGESLNAAGNIFVGMTEAPLMIRPIIHDLTLSELHAVITGGFATIAGSVMATYILFGVPANHLLSASVMAAPCALALSKLSYPETKRSKTTTASVEKMEKGEALNFVQAFSNGASASIALVANIVVNLIAFIAALSFVNAVLSWLGGLAGIEPPDYPNFTFQFVCSYVLWPVAFLMGADVEYCRQVATLLGVKLMLNEFVAYTDLSAYISNRQAFNDYMTATNFTGNYTKLPGPYFDNIFLEGNNKTLVNGIISERSEVIATYALCGFANLSSIGIVLGGLGAIAPSRKNDVAKLVVRAMIVGNVVSWVNACVAGMLFT